MGKPIADLVGHLVGEDGHRIAFRVLRIFRSDWPALQVLFIKVAWLGAQSDGVRIAAPNESPDVTLPASPSRLALYWASIKASIAQASDNDLGLISAGVAFFGMLSLFPALAAVIAVLGLISDPVVVVAQLQEAKGLLPEDVFEIINAQIVTLVNARADTLGWAGLLSLLVALWSARAGVGAMILGLNNVYGEKNRNTANHYFRALLLTLGLVMVGIVALLTMVVAPVALAFVPLGAGSALLAELLRYTIGIAVLLGGVGLLYRFGPNRRPVGMQWRSFGALVAVSSWVLLSFAFSSYVSNFGNYNQIYGSIGAVIAMLIWLWISSFLVLFGGSLNAQIDLRMRGKV